MIEKLQSLRDKDFKKSHGKKIVYLSSEGMKRKDMTKLCASLSMEMFKFRGNLLRFKVEKLGNNMKYKLDDKVFLRKKFVSVKDKDILFKITEKDEDSYEVVGWDYPRVAVYVITESMIDHHKTQEVK